MEAKVLYEQQDRACRLQAVKHGIEWRGIGANDVSGEDWDGLHVIRGQCLKLIAAMTAGARDRDFDADERLADEFLGKSLSAINLELNERHRIGRKAPREKVRLQLADPGRRGSRAAGRTGRDTLTLLGRGDSLADLMSDTTPDEGAGLGDLVRHQLGIKTDSAHGLWAAQGTGTGEAGGFVTPAYLNHRLIDKARSQSRCVQAGALTIPVLGKTSFATLEKDPVATWRGEHVLVPEDSIEFGARTFEPHVLACIIRCSLELLQDSPNINAIIEETLAKAMAVQLDAAMLAGNGVGKPLGVLRCTQGDGISRISMGEDGNKLLSFGPLSLAVQRVAEHNFTAGDFIMAPRTSGGELDRLTDQDDNPLRMPRSVADRSFLSTGSMPVDDAWGGANNASSIVTGAWENLWLAVRTDLTLQASHDAAFANMEVLIRAYLRADSFPVLPRAFCALEGILPNLQGTPE